MNKAALAALVLTTLLLAAPTSFAQSYTITTYAGLSTPVGGTLAANQPIGRPSSLTADSAGNFYFASSDENRVYRVAADGTLAVVAGNGTTGFSGDGGPAVSAQLFAPAAIAVDRDRNVFIADMGNQRIRKVTSGGIISTVAGNGERTGSSGDGIPATSARLSHITGVAADASGNLFIATDDDNRIRKVNSTGVITVVANSAGVPGNAGDGGPAISANLSLPSGIAVDAAGNLFVTEYFTADIRKIDTAGIITTIAGNLGAVSAADGGTALSKNPSGIAVDASGNFFIVQSFGNRVRKVSGGGIISTVTGDGTGGFSGDGGPAVLAQLNYPNAIAVDRNGNVLIADGPRIRKVAPDGIISTIAGNGAELGQFRADRMAVDRSGNVYIADGRNPVIHRVASNGLVTTVVGNVPRGLRTSIGDGGAAIAADLCSSQSSLAVDPAGNLLIGDCSSIRKVSPDGVIQTILDLSYSTAVYPPIGGPMDIVIDGAGSLFIAGGNRIYKVTPDGAIAAIAGTGTPGAGGEGSPALDAQLYSQQPIAVDGSGNVYILDSGRSRIRKVTPDGVIRTAASFPQSTVAYGIAVDAAGNVFIRGLDRVLKVTNGAVSTVAITEKPTSTGNGGPVTSAPFFLGNGIAADAAGDVYFVDGGSIKKAAPLPGTGTPAAPPYTITSIAGAPPPPVRPRTAAVAQQVHSPESVAVAADGVIYAVSGRDNRIYRVARDGTVDVVAGTGTPGFSGDGGPAISAQLNHPNAIAVDNVGNLFIVDAGNSRVRKVTAAGIISTVAGNGSSGLTQNGGDGGFATAAQFNSPRGIAVDREGNLFVLTINTVRKITPDGAIVTVAGGGGPKPNGDIGDGGPAIAAFLSDPHGVAVDAAGNLFIADSSNNRIRKVTPAGIISTVVEDKTFRSPQGVALDAGGNLFIVVIGVRQQLAQGFIESPRIWKVTPAGVMSIVAGNGTWGFGGDGGPATAARIGRPGGVAVDAAGSLYIADSENNRIRKVTANGVINTVLGNGGYNFSGDGGPASSAQLNWPNGVALDAAGNLFIADTWNARIRKITPAGIITTIAGAGIPDISIPRATGDGEPATSAEISANDVAVDAAGNVFIASYDRVRKVAPNGVITTVAGPGRPAPAAIGDGGPATSARMFPSGVAVDAGGNLYIADGFYNQVRKVTPNGTISTVAGNGTAGFGGDGGPATAAQLHTPRGIAVDAAGNLFIADTDNHRIRRITPSGIISTIAGTGIFAQHEDEIPALSAYLRDPRAIALDRAGNLFISDTFQIRKVSTDGIIHTVAGDGRDDFSGDGGAASAASLSYPEGIAVDASGNIFVADASNNRIRKLTPARDPQNPGR